MAGLSVTTAHAAPSTCPSTFEVLHDDRIGALELPAGPYTVTVFDSTTLSCAHASDLFRQFLEDYDGRLPGGWRVNAATASFNRGAVGFSVAIAGGHSGGGGGGRHPAGGTACPGYFRVLHNDHIGALSLPRGHYRITLLSVGRLSCARAATLFARFLQDFNGVLPGAWIVDPATASFMRSLHFGFRVKQVTGAGPFPSGGGTHTTDAVRCAGAFRILHNDRIGALSLPRGRYRITIMRAPRQITCVRASTLLTRFLQDFDGVLPSPWVVHPQRASFTRGQGKRTGFRIKPVQPFS